MTNQRKQEECQVAGCSQSLGREDEESHRENQQERHLQLLESERARTLWSAGWVRKGNWK